MREQSKSRSSLAIRTTAIVFGLLLSTSAFAKQHEVRTMAQIAPVQHAAPAPEPGFYGAWALGISCVLLAVIKRSPRPRHTDTANH